MTAVAVRREQSPALQQDEQPNESRAVATRRADMQIPGTPLTYGDTVRLSVTLFESGLLGKNIKSPQAAFAIVVAGAEMGLPPMASLRSIALVEGKPTLAADLQLGRFKAAGGRAIFRELTEERAVLWLRHPNGDEHIESFSAADAQAAGLLGRDNWKKYRKAMLRSRVITAGLKSIGFEPMAGVYDPDELQGVGGNSAAEFPAERPAYATTTSDNADMPIPLNAAAEREMEEALRELTLDEALAMTLPGSPTAWGNHGGQPLHACGNSLLTGVRAWCEKKVREAGAQGEERPDLSKLIEACTLVIDHREQADATAAANTEPGQIEAALEPTERAKERDAAPARTKRESTPATPDDIPF